MRTIIAGSRNCTDMNQLLKAIAECGWRPTVVISGTARGAGRLGETWAKSNNVPVERSRPIGRGMARRQGIGEMDKWPTAPRR